jgi:hypothetical protein
MPQATNSISDDPIRQLANIFAAGILRCQDNGITGDLAAAPENSDDNRTKCLDLSEESRLSVLGG